MVRIDAWLEVEVTELICESGQPVRRVKRLVAHPCRMTESDQYMSLVKRQIFPATTPNAETFGELQRHSPRIVKAPGSETLEAYRPPVQRKADPRRPPK